MKNYIDLISDKNYNWLWNRRFRKKNEDGNFTHTGFRKVKGIIRMTPNEALVLHKFCSNAEQGIVEIGRKLGGSLYLICKCSNVPVYSVDTGRWDSDEGSLINKCIEEFQDKLSIINCRSAQAVIPQKYDVLFIDGDHTYKGVMRDIIAHWDKLTNVCIFHDYVTCKGVKDAVDFIINENIAEIIVPPNPNDDSPLNQQPGGRRNMITVRKLRDLTESLINWELK